MEQAELLRLYQQMVVIRHMEEKCAELYQQGKIGGCLHLYIGQEATGVGAISARGPHDNVITAYRDHGIAVACGMEPKVALAEMLGKVTGCCKGKGGSMHLADKSLRFWGGHAIVGAHIALATGIAQGVLGGLTVIYLLPTPISVTHACLAQAFFCITIALAYLTSREGLAASAPRDGGPEH